MYNDNIQIKKKPPLTCYKVDPPLLKLFNMIDYYYYWILVCFANYFVFA